MDVVASAAEAVFSGPLEPGPGRCARCGRCSHLVEVRSMLSEKFTGYDEWAGPSSGGRR